MNDLVFDPVGDDEDPTSRLIGSIWIGDLPFHVTAIAVVDDDGFQRAAAEGDDELLDFFTAAFQPDGGWMATEIDGRDYVLFLEPHSR